MAENEKLYDRANQAIHDLFMDQSVSKEKAKENLQGLRDEIDILIDSLDLAS